MENQLKKAIDLARRTGDRLIVYDLGQNHDPFVVMSLNEYEKVVIGHSGVRNLTEDELLDKINRDIAIWKSEQNHGPQASTSASSFLGNASISRPKEREFTPISEAFEERDYFSSGDDELGLEEEVMIEDGPKKKNPWQISTDVKDGAEEIIEEDRQYLEKV